MNDQGSLAEVSDLVVAKVPVDLSTAANNGAWFNMRGCEGVNCVLISAVGTAGDDPVLTLEQATNASGGSSKALNIKRVDYKVGAGGVFAAATDRWQRVTTIDRDNPAASYDSDPIAGAEQPLILSAFVLPNDLDIANDYTHIRMIVADVGSNAQLGVMLYIPSGRRNRGEHNVSHLA